MKRALLLSLFAVLSASTALAQITIDSDDLEEQFLAGAYASHINVAAEGEAPAIQTILDQIGEGNTYDFSDIALGGIGTTIGATDQRPFEGEVPGADNFPDADYVSLSIDLGSQNPTYTFYDIIADGGDPAGGLYKYGSASNEVLVTFSPMLRDYALPLTNNTTWSDSSTRTTETIDGTDEVEVSITNEVVGYGTLILPGGAEADCLVLSVEETTGGEITYAYRFITTDGLEALSIVDADGNLVTSDGTPALIMTAQSDAAAQVAVEYLEEGTIYDSLGVNINFTTANLSDGTLSGYRFNHPSENQEIDNSNYTGDDIMKVSQDGYWFFVASGLSGYTYEICLDYSNTSGVNTPDALALLTREAAGDPWIPLTTTVNTGDQTVCASGLDSFSEFAIGSTDANPLPVELAAFNAHQDGDQVELTWTTASEQNSSTFEIQRATAEAATSPLQWKSIGTVEAAGTTTKPQSYRFVDADVPYGAETVHYRLRQADLDNSATLSHSVEVALEQPNALALKAPFPNPFRGQTTFRYTLPEATDVRLAVYDLLGREVAVLVDEQQPTGRYEVSFTAEGLASGVYFVRLQADDAAKTQRVVITK